MMCEGGGQVASSLSLVINSITNLFHLQFDMAKDFSKYVNKGLICQSDLDFLKELDPSPTKKYLSFIIMSYLDEINLDLLRNRVTEFDTLLRRNQIDRRDINSFKTFCQFDNYVQQHNNIRSSSEQKREAKKHADIILDSEDLFIVCPRSHAASCLYGAGTKWCITMQNAAHFERYYFEQLVTFYFIQVRADKIKRELEEDMWKLAIVVYRDGRITIYDAADHQVAGINVRLQKLVPPDELFYVLGVEPSLFKPRSIDERLPDLVAYIADDRQTELDLSRAGISKLPEEIGCLHQLEGLILSENKIQSLPDTIGLLSNLKTLYLFHNELTSLPETIFELKNLQWLGLTGNPLSNRTLRDLKTAFPYTRIYWEKREAA
jgi:Leucine-rich repeat (LRR) protein